MALTEDDLFRIELVVRTRAERIRKDADGFNDSPAPAVRAHADMMRQEADHLDMAADLLVGLQGDWARLGPMVREGFKRLRAEYERRRAEVAAAKAEAE